MAFDISTARPEQASGGFDLSTAQPEAQEAQQVEQQDQPVDIGQIGQGAGALGLEVISGANRAIAGIIDTFGIDTINAALELGGFESRVPTLTSAITEPRGAFTQDTIAEGLPTDIAAGAGEFAVGALTGQGLIQQGAKQLAPLAASTGARVLRQAAQPGLASTAGLGAVSGGGEAVGQEVGGETGALIGAIAAPLGGLAAVGGGKAILGKLTEKLGKNIGLVNVETGLPTPAFEKALKKRGLDFGAVVDDVERLPVISGRRSPDQVVEQIVRRKLLNGATDDGLAVLKLEGNAIVPDQLGEEALKQGFRAGDISATKAMTGRTKTDALQMLRMNRQILSDSSKAQDFRPTDVVGKNVIERFDFIRGKADNLRLELDNIASKTARTGKNLLEGPGTTPGIKGLKINTGQVEDNAFKELDRLGISSEGFPPKLNFAGSDISKDRTSQRIIKDVVDLLGEGGNDAFRAHKLKRQLDNLIDFNKKSSQGLTKAGKDFAKSIRFSLNQAIREVSPQYARINDELSLSIQTMNDFQQVLGPSIDIFGKGASKAIGQDLRGLLSNRKSRVKLENSINALEDTANSLGGSFKSDVKQLVQFANTLDNRFGAVADTSLKAEFTSSLQQAARGKAGIADLATRKLAEQAEKLRGINDTSALNTIQKILKR